MYNDPMLGKLYENQDCAASRALEQIGERWSLLILRDAIFGGFTRFSEFERALGIAPNILAKRLEGFVADGIFEQHASDGGQSEYRLTEKGRDLKPIIMAMSAWGAKWVRPGRMVYTHAACSHDGLVELQLHCAGCGAEVSPSDVTVKPRRGRRR